MAAFSSLANFLGLAAPELHRGFTLSERGVRMPVCTACGALVAFEGQRVHSSWHRGDGRVNRR